MFNFEFEIKNGKNPPIKFINQAETLDEAMGFYALIVDGVSAVKPPKDSKPIKETQVPENPQTVIDQPEKIAAETEKEQVAVLSSTFPISQPAALPKEDKIPHAANFNKIALYWADIVTLMIPEFKGLTAFDLVKKFGYGKALAEMSVSELSEVIDTLKSTAATYALNPANEAATIFLDLMERINSSKSLEELEERKKSFVGGRILSAHGEMFNHSRDFYLKRKADFEEALQPVQQTIPQPDPLLGW